MPCGSNPFPSPALIAVLIFISSFLILVFRVDRLQPPFGSSPDPLPALTFVFSLIASLLSPHHPIPYRLILVLRVVTFIPRSRAASLCRPPVRINALRINSASKRWTSSCKSKTLGPSATESSRDSMDRNSVCARIFSAPSRASTAVGALAVFNDVFLTDSFGMKRFGSLLTALGLIPSGLLFTLLNRGDPLI